jgi:phosphate:Na+ symporter
MLVEDSLHQLAFSVQSVARGAKINTLTSNFVESLDLFLMLTSDAAVSLGREDITMLQDVCGDRSEMMGRIRNLYLAPEQELPPAEKALLLKLTTLFERIVWMLRRYAGLLEQNLEAGIT